MDGKRGREPGAHNLSLIPLCFEAQKCILSAWWDLQVQAVLLPGFIAVKVELMEGCQGVASSHCVRDVLG